MKVLTWRYRWWFAIPMALCLIVGYWWQMLTPSTGGRAKERTSTQTHRLYIDDVDPP